MKYDDMNWHSGGNFPNELAKERAGTHIAFFLGWAIEQRLVNQEFYNNNASAIEQFLSHQLTPTDLLDQTADGILSDELFSEEGNAFLKDYYEPNCYFGDYVDLLAQDWPTPYHVEPLWSHYTIMAAHLNQIFRAWQAKPKKSSSIIRNILNSWRRLWGTKRKN